MKSMVKYSKMTTRIKGGNKVKKFSLVLALAMALMLTIGVSVAMAAPGVYPPGTQTPSYTTTLDNTQGQVDSTQWGLTNGLQNANKTGTGAGTGTDNYSNVIHKATNADGTLQRVHGEYANNTNACASCHQTHTASGATLLFRNGVYNTCTACHDGTLGAYNVFADGANASNAGTFGGNPDKTIGNASVHLATGVMTTAAAPGGNRASTDAGTWGADFTCASCHAPHGSYSDRLLAYDPNGMNHLAALDALGNPTGGRLKQNLSVASGTDTSGNTIYYPVDATGTRIAGPFLNSGSGYGANKVYYTQIRVKDANGVFQAKDATSAKAWNDVVKFEYRGGYFTVPAGTAFPTDLTQVQMDVAPASVVKMVETQIGTLADGYPVYQVTGYTSGVNDFCAACHADYNSTKATVESGVFSQAFRHKISQNLKTGMIGEGTKMVCLTCHYAHGTDSSLQKDARDTQGTSIDVNPSSALKRYVNMSVCWKCHSSSHAEALQNNNSYWNGVDNGTGPIN